MVNTMIVKKEIAELILLDFLLKRDEYGKISSEKIKLDYRVARNYINLFMIDKESDNRLIEEQTDLILKGLYFKDLIMLGTKDDETGKPIFIQVTDEGINFYKYFEGAR